MILDEKLYEAVIEILPSDKQNIAKIFEALVPQISYSESEEEDEVAGRTRTSLDIMRGLERATLFSRIGGIEAAERATLFSSIRLL